MSPEEEKGMIPGVQPDTAFDHAKLNRLRDTMYSREIAPTLKPRDRRHLHDGEPDIPDDWRHDEHTVPPLMVAPRSISLVRKMLYTFLAASLLFCFGAGGFFLYYFSLGEGSLPASPENIDIIVTGPEQIASGSATQLQVSVANRNQIPLELADLVVRYPSGTRSPTDFVTDLPNQRISLGTIEPGGVRQGTVSAALTGTEGKEGNVKVELEYRAAGSNSTFVASRDYPFRFSSSPISVTVEANKEAISGQPYGLSFTVISNSTAPIRDVVMNVEYPFGFTFTAATPKEKDKGMWELGDINPGERKTISVSGVVKGEANDARVFKVQAGTRKDPKKLQIDTVMQKMTYRTEISSPFLGMSLTINESKNPVVLVSPGQEIILELGYTNRLPVPVTNAVIVAKLSGFPINGQEMQAEKGFYRSGDNTIYFDKNTSGGELASIPAGGSGSLTVKFKTPSGEDLKGLVNPRLQISVNAAGTRLMETGVPSLLQSTLTRTIAFANNTQLVAEGLYYTNPFGSTGPLPPRADVETTYAVVLSVRNTTNKLKNVKVTGVLPPYVRWVGIYSPSTESVKFNQADGTVTWDLKDVEPGVGMDNNPARQAAIALGVTPSTSQIGQEPSMLSRIVLTGIDASSTAPVAIQIKDITTNLMSSSRSEENIVTVGDPGFTTSNARVVR